jgi:indole-3-glycerol phosphate synthase
LLEILEARKKHVAADKARVSLSDLEKKAKTNPISIDFFDAVKRPKKVSLIAEMKPKSPSAGAIRSNYDVDAIAKAYERGGAAALSVLTEPDRFGGKVQDLEKVDILMK